MKRINNHIHLWTASARLFPALLFVMAIITSACSGLQSPAASSGAGLPNTGSNANPAAQATEPAGAPTREITGTAMPAMPPASSTQVLPASAAPGLKAYIGLFKDNAIAVFDTGTGQVMSKIPVPAGPHGLVVTPDGRRVYVSSDGDTKVSVIDTSLDKVTDTIEVGSTPHGLAITPDGRTLLVAVFGTSQVVFIDTARNQVSGQVSVPSPHNIAISPDGHTAYVAAQMKGATGLAIVNIDQRSLSANISTTSAPRALNFSPDGKRLYFTLAGVDAVQVLDPATNRVISQDPVGVSPHHPLFTPDGRIALVVSQGTGELYLLDPQKDATIDALKVGSMPHWIAVSPDGKTAWVTNEGSNDVSVVDLQAFKVTATLPVGSAPRKIVVLPEPMASGPAKPAPASTVLAAITTSIHSMAFTDPSLTVKVGQAITWTNNDNIAHTVTEDQGKWDSGSISPGKSFTLTLSEPGTYSYHCSIHPFMQGKIIVQP